LPSLGKDIKNITKTMRSRIYIVAMVTSNGGGDIRKVAKKVAEKSRRLSDFLQVRAPSQEKQEGVDRMIVGDSERALSQVRTTAVTSGLPPVQVQTNLVPTNDSTV
jgi:hypothetical protein